MTKTYKILLPCLILAFVAFTVIGFVMPSTAKAVENVTTSFTSNRYHDLIFTYYLESESVIGGTNNYRAFWYIDFQVTNNGISAFYYSLDTNFNSTNSTSEDGYIRKPLVLRSYSDTSTQENYFTFTNSTSVGTVRYLDYVCQYEINGNVTNSLPTYYTVTYSSLDNVIWNFTAKNHGYNSRDNAYCVTTHTWGNESYRLSLSFVAQYTRDFYDLVAQSPYSYTMYYSADNTGTDGSYMQGFNDGKLVGFNSANSTVNTDSVSYNAGYDQGFIDGSDGSVNDWSFIFNSASNLLSTKIFGFFSIMDIVTVVCAVGLFLIFLKMFAGG